MRNKRIILYVDLDDYFNMIKRAKLEGFADEKGWVDVNKLFSMLVKTYSSGKYVVLKDESKK